ncbi:MAG: 23S rRNA (adenine(2503)-C(2))-methyltransferase RlmN [Clostridiales Family XIII bacterium]|jgi:23S rRNA (adenine2503-C2)-methyltransferase|nr:23S rRNA (adenine(2503)-C(2))-methyltransferase RlmN [Clostridiales Family XIII bacterium]
MENIQHGTEEKLELYNLSYDELKAFMAEIGEKPYRAKQIYQWLFGKSVTDVDAMFNIPEKVRQILKERTVTELLKPETQLRSADGTTNKMLLKTRDGQFIETVFMKYKYRNSICISSQVGCRMGCTFCASGSQGLVRNLTSGEMCQEIFLTEKAVGAKTKNVVLMGIGEPLDNYENLKKFIENMTEETGRDMSRRAITLSTCGLVPMMARLAEELPQINLAVSLHAPNDRLRKQIMPIAHKYSIEETVAAVRKHFEITRRRSTIEYALIKGFNDSDAHAKELATLLRGMNCLVNLIPLNEAEGDEHRGSSLHTAERFRELLGGMHIPATVRHSLGSDIEAACGQLRLRKSK